MITTQFFRTVALLAVVTFTAAAADQPAAKPLPDGPGKKALERVCTACHGAEIVMGRGLTKDGWTQVVQEMIQRGAQGSEDDFGQIVDYLAKNFPPDGQKADTAVVKVNINKATADEIKGLLDITAEQSAAVVGYREKNGEFKSIDDLKKVPGVDAAKIDAAKDKISFSD